MIANAKIENDIPVLLTATIIPNLGRPVDVNLEERLAEYRRVLQYCQQFAPVILLENSNYPLSDHPEFTNSARLQVHRFQPSSNPELGKGYQEFKMLDDWLASTPQPPNRWLKITGRYQLMNLESILSECRQDRNSSMIIDQSARELARTYLFCVQTTFYREHVLGLYQHCDDRTGNIVERVLYRKLANPEVRKTIRCFKTQPKFIGITGHTGRAFPTGNFQWWAKQGLRRLSHLIDKRHLWYSS